MLVQLVSAEAGRTGRLPTVAVLLALPLFSLSLGLPTRPSLKISSATKEAVGWVNSTEGSASSYPQPLRRL